MANKDLTSAKKARNGGLVYLSIGENAKNPAGQRWSPRSGAGLFF